MIEWCPICAGVDGFEEVPLESIVEFLDTAREDIVDLKNRVIYRCIECSNCFIRSSGRDKIINLAFYGVHKRARRF